MTPLVCGLCTMMDTLWLVTRLCWSQWSLVTVSECPGSCVTVIVHNRHNTSQHCSCSLNNPHQSWGCILTFWQHCTYRYPPVRSHLPTERRNGCKNWWINFRNDAEDLYIYDNFVMYTVIISTATKRSSFFSGKIALYWLQWTFNAIVMYRHSIFSVIQSRNMPKKLKMTGLAKIYIFSDA